MSKIIKIARQFANDLGVDISNVQVAKVSGKIIFSSGNSLRIITAISKEQVLTQLQNKFKDTPEQIEQILQADPTPNKGYSIWIGKLLISKNIILPEDASKILEKINLFEEFKKKGKIKGVDINRLKTYQELAQAVEEASGQKTQGEAYRENLDTGQELVYQDSNFKVIEITTVEASIKLCRGTEWCVQSEEMAEHYLERGSLFLVYKNNSPYVLLHEDTGSAKDVQDATINKEMAKELADIVESIGFRFFYDDFEIFLPYISDSHIMQNLDGFSDEALDRNLISIDDYIDENSENPDRVSSKLIGIARRNRQRLSSEHEQYIVNNPDYVMEYAKYVLKGRFPAGEAVIAQDASESYEYAFSVIHGRFPLGEEAISKDAGNAFMYANNVLDGRFPAGEAAIAKDYAQAYNYAHHVIMGPWPPGEAAIATNSNYSTYYAQHILNGRFPAGEAVIAEDPHNWSIYLDLIKHQK